MTRKLTEAEWDAAKKHDDEQKLIADESEIDEAAVKDYRQAMDEVDAEFDKID